MATDNFTLPRFELGDAMNDDGDLVPAYGFTHADVFITDARLSECGRFDAEPNYYGLTDTEADELAKLNAEARS